MTDVDVETVVRDAFRSHEHLVAGGATGLLDAVRGRVQRRRRTFAVAASGLATLAVLAGAVWLATPHGSGGAAEPPLVSPAAPRRSSVPAPPGWRLESSLGVELTVPAGWETNDFGCGMTAKPSVVRGRGAETQCLTPEPLSKELAVIEQPVGPPFLAVAGRPTSVDGVAASRADGRTGDGRYAGWILIESVHVRVEVRTRDAATTRTILDSVHLVDIDHVGCPTGRPRVARVADSGGGFVTREPAAISICYYGGRATYPLQSSAQLTDEPARQLATALNAARPGGNPNPPEGTCVQEAPPVPDAVLLVRAADGRLTMVWVTYSSCTGRGMDNGVRLAQVTQTLIHLVMKPLHAGYAFNGDLPR